MKTEMLSLGHKRPADLPCVSGVYCIVNTVRGARYVGSSHDVRKRCVGHANKLTSGKHDNDLMQSAWSLDGPDAFAWILLDRVDDPKQMIATEARYIATLGTGCDSGGYNRVLNPCIGSVAESVRRKMSERRKGQKAWNKGVPCSEHVKAANKAFHTGRKRSADARRRMSEAMLGDAHPHRGKRLSPAWREKLSAKVRARGAMVGAFKGVGRDSRTGTYMARIYVDGKTKFLGRYETEIEAAAAYNIGAAQAYGDGCYLNNVPATVAPIRRTTRGRPANV